MPFIVCNDRIPVSTKGFNHIIDITDGVQRFVTDNQLKDGQLLVFVDGSTAAVSTVEYEPGLMKDIPQMYEKIAPMTQRYAHDDTWHDGNGYAHVRSTLTGCSLTVPVIGSRLILGTWQQIILIDFDNGSRNRNIVLQFVGEK